MTTSYFNPVFLNQFYKSLGFSALNKGVTVHTFVCNRVFIDPLVFDVHNVVYNILGDCLEIFSASEKKTLIISRDVANKDTSFCLSCRYQGTEQEKRTQMAVQEHKINF